MKYFIESENILKAEFTFGSFIEAVDFINQVADISEQFNHFPNINLYNGKFAAVSTPGQAEPDQKLAKSLEALYISEYEKSY